jgi:hypothetical protein
VATFEQSPILKQLIKTRTVDALELINGISFEGAAGVFSETKRTILRRRARGRACFFLR